MRSMQPFTKVSCCGTCCALCVCIMRYAAAAQAIIRHVCLHFCVRCCTGFTSMHSHSGDNTKDRKGTHDQNATLCNCLDLGCRHRFTSNAVFTVCCAISCTLVTSCQAIGSCYSRRRRLRQLTAKTDNVCQHAVTATLAATQGFPYAIQTALLGYTLSDVMSLTRTDLKALLGVKRALQLYTRLKLWKQTVQRKADTVASGNRGTDESTDLVQLRVSSKVVAVQ